MPNDLSQEQRQQRNSKKNDKRKEKPAKSITISFRVKPYVLGKALTGILQFNPGFDCDALSKVGKETFNQGLNSFVSAYGIKEISPEAKYILESLSDRIKLDDHDNLLATNRFCEDIKAGGPASLTQQRLESEAKRIMDERGHREVREIDTFQPRNEHEKAFMDSAAIANEQFKQKMAEMERQKELEKEQYDEQYEKDKENNTETDKERQEKEKQIQEEKNYINPHLAKAKSYQKSEKDPDFNPLTDDKESGMEDVEDIDDMIKNMISDEKD